MKNRKTFEKNCTIYCEAINRAWKLCLDGVCMNFEKQSKEEIEREKLYIFWNKYCRR